jgi:hypothetical protein
MGERHQNAAGCILMGYAGEIASTRLSENDGMVSTNVGS